MAATLVTLATAKIHLRITSTDDDPDIQLKLDQAEAVILEYLDTTVAAPAPGPVTAAILLWLARLYEHRGDDDEQDAVAWQAIERLLVRSRTAAIA